jgi:hypothetical protein
MILRFVATGSIDVGESGFSLGPLLSDLTEILVKDYAERGKRLRQRLFALQERVSSSACSSTGPMS